LTTITIGRITEAQMLLFRQEAGKDGLSSYPHPWLMPDFWQFPTVSMGLGPIMAIYQARFMKYLHPWYSPSTTSSMRFFSNPVVSFSSSLSHSPPQMTLSTFQPSS
jgi:pyruvate dehydrogenase complex dehydrogenase (E1) component